MPALDDVGRRALRRTCSAMAGAAGLCVLFACGAGETRAPASVPVQDAEAPDAVEEELDAVDQSVVDGRFAPAPPAADPGAGWAGEDGFAQQDAGGDELGQLARLEDRLRSLGVAVPEHRAWERTADGTLGGSESSPTAKPTESPKPAPARRPSGSATSGPQANDRGKSKGKPTTSAKKNKTKKDKLERKAGRKDEPLSDRDRADGDLLEEKEESERENDRAPQGEAEPMNVGERCEAVCEVAEAICALESRICELADSNPGDRQYAEACERASDDCEVAGQACRECSRE